MNKYILRGKCPVEEPDLRKWARWFQDADRSVRKTEVGNILVSTIFLGIDHNWGDDGPPLLFETLIFGGDRDGDMWQYGTWDEAEAGHDAVVMSLLQEMPEQVKFEVDK